MTLHVDAAVLLFGAILIVGGMFLWLVMSTTGAEVRQLDRAGREAAAARHAVTAAGPPAAVTVVVIPEGSSPSEVQRRIAAAIERGGQP